MSRKFAPITVQELETKVNALAEYDGHFDFRELVEKFEKDLKVRFDCENYEYENGKPYRLPDLIGAHTLSNGLTFWGMCAGGDWEYPVFFIVYWDGKKIRAYVPTEGNPWNTKTKQAYGNNRPADAANAKQRWPDRFIDYEAEEDDDYDDEVDIDQFSFDAALIQQDITERIHVA